MFALYEYGEYVDDCKKRLLDTTELHGHHQMVEKMKELGVDAVIAGNMGGEAKAELLSAGIVPIIGYCGDADTASDLLVTGRLPVAPGDGGCGCGGSCGGSCGCGEEGASCGCGDGSCGCGC
ncbi:MAG: NifB/NifX family molybdenum-iron cluster-binding protein [Oscillospiraceae bacterium]|nr:NifB/NifX family molybdenum-iron cluster-binding protein [Oscillospiraceae bacterium]